MNKLSPEEEYVILSCRACTRCGWS